MTLKTTKLRDAITFALAVGATALTGTGVAFAQDTTPPADDDPTTLDRIEVTGTRIRRVDAETASPVFTLDRAQIEATGAVTVGDFLQETPAISGAATNPQVNNGGGSGAATISLRGLGSARTKILVNGRNLITADVNAIPINMIERVEVLKDGAGAVYGSDAIGGVVNFITRKDFDGAIISAQTGVSSRGDGATTGASLTVGRSTDRGSIIMGLNYDKQEEVRSSARDHSRAQFYYYNGHVGELGSSRIPTGRYVVPRSRFIAGGGSLAGCPATGTNLALTRIQGRPGNKISDFRCFITSGPNNDFYNFQVANLNVTPQERVGLFVNGAFQLNDNMEAYVETFFHNTQSNFEIAAEPFDGRPSQANVPLSRFSIFNPFGVDITDSRLRLINVGNRTESFDTNRFQSTLGLKGGIGDSSWSYDVGWTYGKEKQTTEAHGELFRSKLAAALGPSFIDATGTPRCGTPIAIIPGCTPVDFFGPPPAPGTDAFNALQAIAPYFHDRFDSDLNIYYAGVTGDLWELPGGMMQLAAGIGYGRETLDFRPDALRQLNPITGECDTSGNCSSAVAGELSRKDAYAELYLPILADVPFAKRLALTLGSRYSDYSAFGVTVNSKLGLEWKPIEDLLLRGTFSEVFRSPTISNLFSPISESADTFTDPCNGFNGTTNSKGARIAPGSTACANVPTNGTFRQSDSQLNALTGGNPNLLPEVGWVRTLGFVYSPSFIEGLSFTVDYWNVKLTDNIGGLGSQVIVDACYDLGAFCNLMSREAAGEIFEVDNRLTNPGRVDTKGVDFSVKYAFRDTPWGSFRTSLDTTYTAQYDRQVLDPRNGALLSFDDFAGEFAESSSGGDGHFARWRALGAVDWTWGDWTANYRVRYIHHVDEQAKYSGGLLVNKPSGELRVPAITYQNIALGYTFLPGTKFTVGVDNFTDKTAPIVYGGFNGSTDVRTYDTVGRFFWVRAEVKF